MRLSLVIVVFGTILLAAVAVSLCWAGAVILLDWIREQLRP